MHKLFEMTGGDIVRVVIAALGGAAVGLERQWSGHADGQAARFAGIRTFTMLGAIAGVSGVLWIAGVTAPAAILLSGAVAIVAAAYMVGSRQDIDGTTEAAALVLLWPDSSRGSDLSPPRAASSPFSSCCWWKSRDCIRWCDG
jgi:hypothetical protein